MENVQYEAKKFKCNFCLGELMLTIIKDSRNYKPYFYNCPFCSGKVDSGLC